MVKPDFSHILRQSREFGIPRGTLKKLIKEYQAEYFYPPKSIHDLLEVVE